MKDLLNSIQIQINNSLFLKDPVHTELGKKILINSSIMINEIGFEAFTFKKLALELKTTESSVYRYFENKHNLLIYLISWYWGYMENAMVYSCVNIESPIKKLEIAIDTLCSDVFLSLKNDFIDKESLNELIISESSKMYLTKTVDKENKDGYFLAFKRPCVRLAQIIKEINPLYKFPHSLASSTIEGIISQKYFDQHLMSLTDFDNNHKELNTFYKELILNTIIRK